MSGVTVIVDDPGSAEQTERAIASSRLLHTKKLEEITHKEAPPIRVTRTVGLSSKTRQKARNINEVDLSHLRPL
ncbi:hypothetical protein D3C86_819250 [compost metagenome]